MNYLKEDWKGTPVYEYFDWKLTFTGVKEGDKWVGSEQIKQDMSIHHKDWMTSWKSVHQEPNGQVKNYLVAIRTLAQAPKGKPLSIFIRGSKLSESGGLWHQMFLDFVARRNGGSEITFCDPTELPRHFHEKLVVKYLVDKIDEVNADVLIDDAQEAWEAERPPAGKYEFFSYKKQGEPFVTSESRRFSHTPVQEHSICPCRVCKVIAQSVRTYEEDQLVRNSVLALGWKRCVVEGTRSQYLDSDMKRVYIQMREQTTSGNLTLRTPQDERVVKATAHFLGRRLEEGKLVEKGGINESLLPKGWQTSFGYSWTNPSCNHVQCDCGLTLYSETSAWKILGPDKEKKMSAIISRRGKRSESDCHLVRGKLVEFFGVPSTFFGNTVLSKDKNRAPEVVVLSPQASLHYATAPMVFSQYEVPGFQRTPYMWCGYSLSVRASFPWRDINVPGFVPMKTRELVTLSRFDPGIKRGVVYYVSRRDSWLLTREKAEDSVLALRIASGAFSAHSITKIQSCPMLRPGFEIEWITGIDGPLSQHKISVRYMLIAELRAYARQVPLSYSKVLTLPTEIQDLINWYIIS